MGSWRASLKRVGSWLLPTLVVLVAIGGLGLLSYMAADAIILQEEPVIGFVCLGAMFWLCLEVVDFMGDYRDGTR
jgi:hypothetical protein